jgi:hypothetical protein
MSGSSEREIMEILAVASIATVLLDEVDRDLKKRGHAFVRYADDCNVSSASAAIQLPSEVAERTSSQQLSGQPARSSRGGVAWTMSPW